MTDLRQAALQEMARRELARRQSVTPGQEIMANVRQSAGDRLSAEALPDNLNANKQSPNVVTGSLMNFADAALMGAGDEAGAALTALVDQTPGAFSDRYGVHLERNRAAQDAFNDQHPVAATTSRIAGAVASPAARIGGPVTTIRGAAASGAAFAGAEGFAEGEGGVGNRVVEAATSAPVGLLFSGLTSSVLKGGNAAVKAAFQRAEKRPSLETLRSAKNTAYAAVRKSGVDFDTNDLTRIFNRASRKARTVAVDLDPSGEFDRGAFDALRVIERRVQSGKPISLNNLDKVRQRLFTLYQKHDHPFILEIIGEVDDSIAQKAEGNEIMQAARAANAKFAKAQLLENAFRKARRQTASTGSGGNTLNNYRRAVVRILESSAESRFFSADELAMMENFVMGDGVENTLRRAGKLAPSGNGLMLALNVYAASIDPTMLAVTAAGQAAKSSADRSALKGADHILDAVSTGIFPQPTAQVPLNRLSTGGTSLNDLRRE